jgi:hypothetical protein
MARVKTELNRKEQKQADTILAAHPKLIASIEYSDIVKLFVIEGTSGETYESEDLDEAIAEALDAEQELLVQRTAENEDPEADAEEGERNEDLDDEDGDTSEAKSIVPAKYRVEYKARGDATRCSDWFCEAVDPYVTSMAPSKSGKGKAKRISDVEATYKLAAANGVTKRWSHLNPGQQCMNARNMTRAKVVEAGILQLPASLAGEDRTLEADPAWLASKRGSSMAIPFKA